MLKILKYTDIPLDYEELCTTLLTQYIGRYPIIYTYVNRNIIEHILTHNTTYEYKEIEINLDFKYEIKGKSDNIDVLWLNTIIYYFSNSNLKTASNINILLKKTDDMIMVNIY
jgi:hypothetical protein